MNIICRLVGHWWRLTGYEREDGAVCLRDQCGICGCPRGTDQ